MIRGKTSPESCSRATPPEHYKLSLVRMLAPLSTHAFTFWFTLSLHVDPEMLSVCVCSIADCSSCNENKNVGCSSVYNRHMNCKDEYVTSFIPSIVSLGFQRSLFCEARKSCADFRRHSFVRPDCGSPVRVSASARCQEKHALSGKHGAPIFLW